VWGESDLYRSLDIINPLRVDQNFAIGEKFDEFRYPILSVKSFYDIGNVGESLSNVGIETFYSPRWASGSTNLLLEMGGGLSFKEVYEDGWGSCLQSNCAHATLSAMRP
jgi:hypothetical protein